MAATSVLKLKVDDKEYKPSLKQAQQGMQHLERALQDAGKSFTQVDKSVVNYVRSIGQMETQAKTARGKIGEMTNAFVELSTLYNKMSDEVKRSDVGKALSASLEQLKQRTQEAKRELQDLNKQLDEKTASVTGELGNVIDKLGSKLGISGNLTEMLTSKTALMTAGIGASVAIIGKATDAWVSYNSQLAKQDQITTVTTGLKGVDSDRMTDSARAMVDTYNVDFRSVINAANTLMTQFGETGEQATQLIREGLQGMIQGDGPKLLSMIQQYAPAFRDAGVSASQLVAVIQNSEGGIFTDQNMNAIVMGIKNIRLMTNATSEALAKLGIDGEKMSRQLSDGTLTIFDALKQVATAIQGVNSNSKAAGEVMQTVFGRQGTMAGTKLGEAIATLNTNLEETKRQTGELGDAYDDLYKANEKLNKAIRDCFEYDGWDQMATGIKANLITALSSVVDWLAKIKNGFTEAGRARNAYNSMGGDGQVNSQIDALKNANLKFYTYNDQVSQYNQRINSLQAQIANGGKPVGGGSGSSQSLDYLNAQLAAVTRQRDEYRKQAADVLKQQTKTTYTTTPTTTTTTTTPSRGGGGGSHVETAQEQAAKKVNAALASYAATIEKADMRMEAGLDTEADHKKKQLAAQERLYDAYTDAYTIYKDPSYKEASLNAAKEIERLAGEVKETTDAQAAAKKAAQQQEQAQRKLAEATDAAAKAVSQNDLKGFIAANRKVEGMGGTPSIIDPSAFTATSDNVDALLADLKNRIKEADLGSDLQLSLMAKMQDTATLGQLIQTAIDESVQGADFSKAADAIMTAILSGDVPDDKIQDMLELINEKIREHGGMELEINAKGNVQRKADPREGNPFLQKTDDGYEAKLNDVLGGVASGMNQVVGGLEQLGVDVPEGIKNVLGGMQAISAILTGIATTILAIEAITAADAIIPFAQGGIVGRAAAGMLIPGNSLSGDRLRMPVDTGGYVGVNSGELILNKAQSNVIASALDGQGQQTNALQPYVDGEKIFLGMNNTSKRMGRGEIVTTGMLRKLGLMG